jgi:hypothetical protein
VLVQKRGGFEGLLLVQRSAVYVVAAPFFFLSAVFGFFAPLLLPGPLSPI